MEMRNGIKVTSVKSMEAEGNKQYNIQFPFEMSGKYLFQTTFCYALNQNYEPRYFFYLTSLKK